MKKVFQTNIALRAIGILVGTFSLLQFILYFHLMNDDVVHIVDDYQSNQRKILNVKTDNHRHHYKQQQQQQYDHSLRRKQQTNMTSTKIDMTITETKNKTETTERAKKKKNPHHDHPKQAEQLQQEPKAETKYKTTPLPPPSDNVVIVIQLIGSLGNQMFQYASMVGIANEVGLPFCIQGDTSLLERVFMIGRDQGQRSSGKNNVSSIACTEQQLTVNNKHSSPEYLFETGFAIHSPRIVNDAILSATKANANHNNKKTLLHVATFLQSYKYFHNITAVIRQQFVFQPAIQKQAHEMFQRHNLVPLKQTTGNAAAPTSTTTTVGIHIRRGDKVNVPYPHRYEIFPPLRYFEKAMHYFRTKKYNDGGNSNKEKEKVVFLVATDDIDWCSNLSIFNGQDVIFTNQSDLAVDLAILSSCDHVIRTIGSFGWWAGWLSKGTVVYYDSEFDMNHKMTRNQLSKDDHYPKEWVPIGVDLEKEPSWTVFPFTKASLAEQQVQRKRLDPDDIYPLRRNLTVGDEETEQQQRVVYIIVPYRDRFVHYQEFIKNAFRKKRSGVEVHVVIVEQADFDLFRRGWLINVGIKYISKSLDNADNNISSTMTAASKNNPCIVTHDVDTIPNPNVDYTWCDRPTQICSELSSFNYTYPYPKNSGGVVAATLTHFQSINGFTNKAYGWGGEDDDLYHRFRQMNLLQPDSQVIRRPDIGHGICECLNDEASHTARVRNGYMYQKIVSQLDRMANDSHEWRKDGLSTTRYFLRSQRKDEFGTLWLTASSTSLKISKRGSLWQNKMVIHHVTISSRNVTYGFPEQWQSETFRASGMLIIGVASATSNFQHRESIRETWGKDGGTLLFLVAGSWNADLALESGTYGDILWLDMTEICNTTQSQVFFSAIYDNMHSESYSHILKTDDACYVQVKKLITHVRVTNDADYMGFCIEGGQMDLNNSSKHFVSEEIFPGNVCPIYASGWGYVMSKNFLQCARMALDDLPFLPMEDVATGILAERCKTTCMSDTRFCAVEETSLHFSNFIINNEKASGTWMYDLRNAILLRQIEGVAQSSARVLPGPVHHGKSNTTIVTAYFELSKSKHSKEEYREWMTNMLATTDNMIIFTPSTLVEKIEHLRSHAAEATTKVIAFDLNETMMAQMFPEPWFWSQQEDWDPEKGKHTKEVYLIWNEKLNFLLKAIAHNPFGSSLFLWTDIGYFRDRRMSGKRIVRFLPQDLKQDQMIFLDTKTINDNKPELGGGMFGGFSDGIKSYADRFYTLLRQYGTSRFIGKDQEWYDKTCRKMPESCALFLPTQKFGDPWFTLGHILHHGNSETMIADCTQTQIMGEQKEATAKVSRNLTFPMAIHHYKEEIISQSIISRGCIECNLVREIASVLQDLPHAYFIDVGSNIGMFALAAAATGADVYAFEALRSNWELICSSIRKNLNFEDRITVYKVALTNDTDATFTFEKPVWRDNGAVRLHRQMNLEALKGATGDGVDFVQGVSLDSLLYDMPRHRPAVIKINVEGGECDVIRGATRFFQSRDVAYVSIKLFHNSKGRNPIDPYDNCKDLYGMFDLLSSTGLEPFSSEGDRISVGDWRKLNLTRITWKNPKYFSP